MTAYEAAMKRFELKAEMASELLEVWTLAEEGDFESAMYSQFMYLMAQDEWLNLWMSEDAEGVYWDMVFAAGGSYD